MQIKVFDENHEHDLEIKVNQFLRMINNEKIISLQYQVAMMNVDKEQIYCFSCMIVYNE